MSDASYVPCATKGDAMDRCIACGRRGCWFWIQPAVPAVVNDPAWEGRDAILVALDGVVVECQRPRCRASYRLVERFVDPLPAWTLTALTCAGPLMAWLYARRAATAIVPTPEMTASSGATVPDGAAAAPEAPR